jgi:diguanylate cyclase (GGDEF)-like protein
MQETKMPINRALFFSSDLQRRFTLWIYHFILILIVIGWIWDFIRFSNNNLEFTPGFWIRQGANVLIILHGFMIRREHYSFVLLSISTIMNLTIIYLSIYGDFFPTNYFIFLAIVPTAIVNIFYERRLSQWYIAVTCLVLAGSFLLVFGISQIWNVFLIVSIFSVINLIIYLQSPSIKLLQKVNEIRESQYTEMLHLVYDGIAVCRDGLIIDADNGFYDLFKIPPEYHKELYLTDFLSPDLQQSAFEALHQKKTILLQGLGKKFDGTVVPLEMNMVHQENNKIEYTILAIHDASRQMNAEIGIQRKNDELFMINRISQAVNSSLSLGEVLSAILEESQEIYRNRSSSLWLLDDNQEFFVCVNAKGTLASKKIGKRVNMHSGLFQEVLKIQEPLFIENIQQDALLSVIKNTDHGFDVLAVLILPIVFQGKIIGLLQFLDDRVNILHKEDIEVLKAIATNSAIAINNARQFEQLAGDQQRWRTLQIISQRINACLQPQEIFRAITDNIGDILKFDFFGIALINNQIGGYDIVHLVDHKEHLSEYHLEKGAGLTGLVIENSKALLIDNFPVTHADLPDVRFIDEDDQTKSIIAVPLKRGTNAIGMLTAQSYEKGIYQSADLQMLELIAAHTVIALDNARHYQEALESARLRDIIYLIGQEINSRLNPDQVYDTIYRALGKVIPMDFMFISSVDYEHQLQNFLYFKDKDLVDVLEPFSAPLDRGISGYVIKSGKSFRTGDFTQVKIDGYDFVHIGEKDHITHSLIYVPLIRGPLVTGLLSVQAKEVNMFTAYHQTLVELIAPYAASALENAWLFSKIETLAITDELSGVYNRHHFNQILKQEFERCLRYERPLSLIIIDIDNFKEINDRYGHICGDEVIRQYGAMLKENVRTTDILARFGGDEFAIIMPETNAQQALVVTRKIESLCNQRKFNLAHDEISVTISIGLAEMIWNDDLKPEDLIHKADHAMYQAKNQGRSRTVLFER